MQNVLVRTLLAGAVAGTLSGAALAQAEPQAGEEPAPVVVYPEKTELIFDGLGITATGEKPSGVLMLERKRGIFNPLIRLRVDFDAELASSVAEVR